MRRGVMSVQSTRRPPLRPRLTTPEWVPPLGPLGLIGAGCVALAALSLLWPSAPTYDPFSWLIWGREILHLDLVTTDGPSWKPLPVAITTLLAPTGAAAPWLWLVVARTGGLMALVGTYRLAARLAGWPAGLLAVAGLVLSREWLRDSWLGNSEGIVLALLLFAVERHLDGHRRPALVLGFLAGLLRPEVWPFLGLYGLWLWFKEPRERRLIVVLAGLIPLLWFVPEAIGSGDPFRAAARAKIPAPGSRVPALSPHPVRVLIDDAQDVLIKPARWGFALGIALCLWRPRRRDWITLAIAAWAVLWFAEVAAMTAHGYSGNPRYLIAPGGLACVVAGVGWVKLGRLVVDRVPLPPARVVAAAGLAAVFVIWSLQFVNPRVALLKAEARIMRHEAHITSGLHKAIARAGGAAHLRACGTPYTGPFQVPRVAWELDLHITQIGLLPAPPGAVFQAPLVPGSPPVPMRTQLFRFTAAAGPWRIYESCAP
jgi:hypothetical protein